MINQIRTHRLSKIIASYLAIQLVVTTVQPMQIFALTSGPSQPEFNSFTPIGTSDMVNLSSGDFNYNIPVMDVGGYPLNLAYNSGVSMDQESSWVGLGWNLNVGQISRSVRGLPDDFNGDKMIYENNMKDNVTIGANVNVFAAGFGIGEGETASTPGNGSASVGLGMKYNNYDGFGFALTGGLNYQISENLSAGMNMSASASDGTSVSPSISLHHKYTDSNKKENSLTGSLGTTLNSRKGITNLTMSASRSKKGDKERQQFNKDKNTKGGSVIGTDGVSGGGSISFIDASYTPTKRVGMVSSNYTFSLNIEGEIWGFEPGAKFAGYRTSQGIRDSEKYKEERAFGFENSFSATKNDVLDFNREKDRTFNQFTTTLPITNNTYDIYSIQGQGISGMYRPYKSQVGHVFDNYTKDISNGGSLGLEFGGGGGVHWGFDGEVTPSNGKTSVWEEQNNALPKFRESTSGNNPAYEKVFFKNIGGFHVDNDLGLLDVGGTQNNSLGGYNPIKIGITGGQFARTAEPKYLQKKYAYGDTNPIDYRSIQLNTPVKRTERLKRNQTIQKLTRKEATQFGFQTKFSPYSQPGKHDNHTSEVRILKNDGSRYIYGQTAYNVVKKEVTFDVSGRTGDCKNGLVSYSPGSDNTPNNNRSGDQYFNRITTPAYAHTYLLTSVLSSDYEDLTGDGPSDDDLGAYTKFTYENKNEDLYKWRVPYDKNKANYNEGIRSSAKDDKGNYIYGEKELVYIEKIETKTHIAKFHLSPRKDALGVIDENGGGSSSSEEMWKLDKISLYAKPEYEANGDDAEPIKEAHFVYDYSLCKNVKNNFGGLTSTTSYPYSKELSNDGGKLTLQKVYFTYRDSKMGEYTPYAFNYEKDLDGDGTIDNNPNYDQKGYDTWGNYLPTSDGASCNVESDLTNAEYPYVNQANPDNQQDIYANAWSLTSIDLPSGGNIEMEYESDDYRYVQNKEVMSMFKVVGAGNSALSQTNNGQLREDLLYKNATQDASHLYIRLNEDIENNPDLSNNQEKLEYFQSKYIKDLGDETVYFRFLLNMTKPGGKTDRREDDDFDFVTGYLKLDGNNFGLYNDGTSQYASIPINRVNTGDGLNNVNPITKAGWDYGRKYLNRKVYSISNEEDTNDLEGVVMEIIGAIPAIFAIFSSPNGKLRERNIARRFITEKSWVRLMHPNEKKLGGGCRVKSLRMNDQWGTMTGNPDNELYEQFYGQEYNYETEEGKSSGVATYEPLGGKENPFVQPFYDKDNPGLLLGPDESNYVEKPLGESFFPSPTITYSKVTVKNLDRERTDGENQLIVKKHATGFVVNEFYTSYDYPTLADNTDLTTYYDKSDVLSSLLNLRVRDNLTLSQGYSIHTNDMNGKMRRQRVYAEGQDQYISGVDYNYEVLSEQQDPNNPNQGRLNNIIKTIDSDGNISERLVGVDYDVINDFRDTKTVTETYGVKFNTAGLPLFLIFIIVPIPLPKYSRHESQIKMAVTTKVIHSSGIMREKVAYDVGSKVSTKNLAWDASTGEVLLTKTINEYGDNYYNFNYPAYWAYDGMGQAAENVGVEWKIQSVGGSDAYQLQGNYTETDYLLEGDELWLQTESSGFKAWIVETNNSNFKIIDEDGILITTDDFSSGDMKVIRSGRRNLQSASMASVTSMVNPIEGVDKIDNSTFYADSPLQYRIVNSSAVEYDDIWAAQCECNLPKMQFDEVTGDLSFDYQNEAIAYNPYRYNIKGNWRAKRSFAYLTGRNSTDNPTPRKTGFYNNFRPLYNYTSSGKWNLDPSLISQGNVGEVNKWTFASEVSQYNPYGLEIENKDALDRYSSALYGYNNRLPVAVASNTKYKELGYDGFEDYDFVECDSTAHFSFQKNTLENTISITNEESHTGRKSLKVAPNSSATISQQIIDCDDISDNNGGSGDRAASELKGSKED